MKKSILVVSSLLLCVLLLLNIYEANEVPKYSPGSHTFVSKSFYVDSLISVNQLDENQKRNIGVNTDYISFDITFDLIPKDSKRVYSNIKVDAYIDEELSKLLLIPSQGIIKSYDDYGADIGNGMETFAISLGKLSWIDQKTLSDLTTNIDVLKNDVKFEVSWEGGDETFVIPNDYLKIIINN